MLRWLYNAYEKRRLEKKRIKRKMLIKERWALKQWRKHGISTASLAGSSTNTDKFSNSSQYCE